MESSLREYVCDQITDYAEHVKRYFDALALVAENATQLDQTNQPETIIKEMATVDDNLQKAIEHSK